MDWCQVLMIVSNKLWDSKCDINDYQQHARINKDPTWTTQKIQGLPTH
jgi:hypothetical protein